MKKTVPAMVLAAALIFILAAGLRAASDFVPVPDIDKYLTPANMEKLKAGEVVKENIITKDASGKDSGRGVALITVGASKEKILATLEDYPTYPAWMPNTTKTTVVKKEGDRIDVEFELSILGQGVNYTVIHKVDKEKGTIQWRMDDSKPKKNVQDSVGAWVIKPLSENRCAVAYTVAVDTGISVPKFIQDWLSNKSLVKVEKAVRERVEGKK